MPKKPHEDARFTDLVCGLSSRLAVAPYERIPDEVGAALEAIREFFGIEQCSLFRFVVESRAVVLVQRAVVEGVPPIPAEVDYGRAFPLTYRTVVEELRPYILESLDDLPPGEAVQRDSALAMGLGAFVALPIVMGGVARYSLGLGSHQRSYRWPRDRIRHMQALGEIIAGAVERHEDEERVRRSEAQLAQAQAVTGIGSWSRDFVADHFSISEEGCRLIGARPATIAQWEACVHPEDREAYSTSLAGTLAARLPTYRLEYRVIHPDGAERTIVDAGEVHYHADGHAERAIGTIRDVTESRRLVREMTALRTNLWHADRAARAGAMGASISHELGQPLAAMLANAQAGLRFLKGGRAGAEEIRAILESIVRDDKRAIAIIDGIRSLLRNETPLREPVDVSEAIEEVLGLMRREIASLEVRLERELAPGAVVPGSKAQLQQVVMNLVSNAIEAVRAKPPGSRRIRVACAKVGRSVEVTVSDSGRGIPKERRESLFEAFRSTRSGGLGLGLVIARSILESHDGRIGVEDGELGGATFRLELPASVELGAAVAPPAAPGAIGAVAEGAGPLVAIVDDDPAVREGIARLLVSSGYAVVAFESGESFLAGDMAGRVACAVIDVRMRGLTGPELHARIAREHPALPVIFLTAHGDLGTGIRALQSGAVDFLLKPVDDVDLVAAVEKAVAAGDRERTRARAAHEAAARLARLTPREREILDEVARGRLNKQIAADLGIAEATVKQHRGRGLEKVGVRSVPELVRLRDLAAGAGSPEGPAPRDGTSYQGRIPSHDDGT